MTPLTEPDVTRTAYLGNSVKPSRNYCRGAPSRRAPALPFDPGKIRHRAGGLADFVQQLEPGLAQRLVVDVDRDLVEEGVDLGPQLGHRRHGGGEVFL